MARGSLKTGRALVEVTIDVDVSEFPALEAGFIGLEVVTGKGGIIVAVSLPDFSVSDGSFFFFGQRR